MTPDEATAAVVEPGAFEPARHFYPRTLNAQIHPLVRSFFLLENARVAERYCHLHPGVAREAVDRVLAHVPRYFRWGGTDLFLTTTEDGLRRIVVIETNSSPSGQKSMPILDEAREQGGYRVLLERSFLPLLKRRSLPAGRLAVVYDKNEMEASGYAAVLADLTGEAVHLSPCFDGAARPACRVGDAGVLEVRGPDGWEPVRAALRYVTQRPWNRIPPLTRSALFNPVLVCLAGGRNKMLAAKAYDMYNAELEGGDLGIRVPETIWDVGREEVPLWVRRMGGVAVVKVPYSNAGQGVYTVTSEEELAGFMAADQRYERFVVQALIGNIGWSSRGTTGKLYHVGTVPDRRTHIHVADLRFMVGASPEGFYPVAIYARRARRPLARTLDGSIPSWDMLGTNLSVKEADGSWTTQTERLLLMDSRDFNRLGIGLDDLIEGYLQSVMAVTAIDEMAQRLVTRRGRFRTRRFRSINPDAVLAEEIRS